MQLNIYPIGIYYLKGDVGYTGGKWSNCKFGLTHDMRD